MGFNSAFKGLKNAHTFGVGYPVFPFQLKIEAHPASKIWVF
jgi:hypothetical protein